MPMNTTQRIAASYARIEDAYRHRDNGVVPFLVTDVNYWLSGETMMRYQFLARRRAAKSATRQIHPKPQKIEP
jgi:hypothetical protein